MIYTDDAIERIARTGARYDRSVPIAVAHLDRARETMLLARGASIDSVIAWLRETRVRRIVEAVLAGERAAGHTPDDDFACALDPSLIQARAGRFEIADPLHRDLIPRGLRHLRQM